MQAYLDTLSTVEREQFIEMKLLAAVVETVESPKPTNVEARASVAAASLVGGTVSPMAAGCWTARTNGSAKAAAGNTLYTYYHVGGYCSSGSTITSAWVADSGGETSTPGWSYKGVISTDSGIVSNQGRSYSQMKFELGSGGWVVQSPTPCLRINGLSSGGVTASSTCGIY